MIFNFEFGTTTAVNLRMYSFQGFRFVFFLILSELWSLITKYFEHIRERSTPKHLCTQTSDKNARNDIKIITKEENAVEAS